MKNNVIKKVMEEDCCGCSACANKCPVNAITMSENEEGFLHPLVNEDVCVECGACFTACPSLNAKKENFLDPKCYAVAAQDEIRATSSSGGLFTLLAEYTLQEGGVVCGAAFDKNWNVHHILIDNPKDLNKLKGSKYVQSAIENTYSEIQKLLNKGKKVLFSGTPCQVAGLNTFLGKEYFNLLTMDILCHGAPSRGVWQKHLKETFDVHKIRNVNFRDKTQIGWSCSHCTVTLDNNSKVVSDAYTKLFHQSIILNKTCQNCKYSSFPRPADITGGDWWGISNHQEGLNDGKGLSFVLINSAKGEKVFETIQREMKLSLPINLKRDYNNGHLRHNDPHHVAREKFFFNYLNNLPLAKAYNVSANSQYDVGVVSSFFGVNYGAVLVAHAVHKIISDMGYSVLMINKPSFLWPGHPTLDSVSGAFALKHYNISRVYNSISDLSWLNNYCNNFVVGSDQLFTPTLHVEHSFLEFVKLQKNKIAFGTSFGRSEYNKTPEEIQKNKYLLNRFNHIALREKSTELENLFNLKKAEEIIDPTLMIDAQYWGKLSDGVSLAEAQEPYLLAYMLDLTENKINVLKYISSTLSLKIILIPDLDKRHRRVKHDLPLYKDEYTPEEFLYLYKNASFVVTDSYHGTCFATKFNKPFISIINRARGGLRYKLFDAIKVSSRLVDNPDDIYNNAQLFQPFDFSETNKIIQKKTDFAVTWLKDALSHNNSEEKFSENELYASSQVIELSRQLDELSTRVTHISKLAESNMKKNDHPHIDKQTTLKITSYFGGIVKKVNNERSKKLYLLGIPIYNKEHL